MRALLAVTFTIGLLYGTEPPRAAGAHAWLIKCMDAAHVASTPSAEVVAFPSDSTCADDAVRVTDGGDEDAEHDALDGSSSTPTLRRAWHPSSHIDTALIRLERPPRD